jgi:protein involved in plasmid replication-relaxation
MAGSSSSGGTRPTRARSSAQTPALSDLDRRILDLLSFLRVLTQTQLASLLSPEIQPRTLRYRTARLTKHGLVGRTRPYRERGSAPHHLWPTRKGEAIAEGGPPPRGGERREPNPLFLAHAAAISELYVALKTELPDGLRLAGFEREAEGRETFRGYDGKEHAVAPDACIQIEEAGGRVLLGLVELDLGTMSARQLKAKAERYGEYAKLEGWRQRNSYCPPLLFITTNEKRARSFLAICRRAVDRDRMLVAATVSARDLGRALTAPKWFAGEREDADLLAVLRGARRPYDEACERQEAERREKDAERVRLRSDPGALREHLRRWRHRDWGIGRLGPLAATALEVTLERDEEPGEAERQALLALGAMFADPLRLQLAEGEPSPERRAAFSELVEYQRTHQLQEIGELAGRFGEGPALRKARGRLQAGELLVVADLSSLRLGAEDDGRSRAEQERLRSSYLSSREKSALYSWKSQHLVTRLRSGPEDFLQEIDRKALRLCRTCEEVAYPDPERARYERERRDVAFRCHFCDGRNLAEWEPRRVRGQPFERDLRTPSDGGGGEVSPAQD